MSEHRLRVFDDGVNRLAERASVSCATTGGCVTLGSSCGGADYRVTDVGDCLPPCHPGIIPRGRSISCIEQRKLQLVGWSAKAWINAQGWGEVTGINTASIAAGHRGIKAMPYKVRGQVQCSKGVDISRSEGYAVDQELARSLIEAIICSVICLPMGSELSQTTLEFAPGDSKSSCFRFP